MKRPNHILLAGLLLVASVSCNKQFNPSEEPEAKAGVPLTLTATIGGADTKLSYTADGNGLKATWGASEKISVITYSGTDYDAKVETIDTFSYSGGAGEKSVDFTGSFTGDASNPILVLYPAVEDADKDGEYRSATGSIYGMKIGESDFRLNLATNQETDNSFSFLDNNTILYGSGTISGSTLDVPLKHFTSIVKLEITFSGSSYSDDFVVRNVNIVPWDNEGNKKYAFWGDHSSIGDFPSWTSDSYQTPLLSLGGTEGLKIGSSRKITVYVPFAPKPDIHMIKKIRVYINDDDDFTNIELESFRKTEEAGKIYRMTVDFPY